MSTNGNPGFALPVPKYSKELQTAVQDDRRRQEIDSAKKRAAAQNVDYESFAALVAMAHVKPFERKKGQQGELAKHINPSPAWSFDARGQSCSSDNSISVFNDINCEQSDQNDMGESLLLPKTQHLIKKIEDSSLTPTQKWPPGCSKAQCMPADSFKREWRRQGAFHQKLNFLLGFSPNELPNIFKVELPSSILSDVINVLHQWKGYSASEKENASASEIERTLAVTNDAGVCGDVSLRKFDSHLACLILKYLSACGRFSLSIKLAGTRITSLANELIKELVDCMEKIKISSKRVECKTCMLSKCGHDATSSNACEDASTYTSGIFEGETLGFDELEHLATVYA